MPEFLFREIQRHNQLLFRIIIFITALFPLAFFGWTFFVEVIIPYYNKTRPIELNGNILSLSFSILFSVLIFWLWAAARLETFVDGKGITVRYYPFMIKFKEILAEEIDSFRIRKYSPLVEFGGWGIRFSLNGKRAYNAIGNIGMQLELKDSSSILIGTCKPDEFRKAMEHLFKLHNLTNKFSN